MARLRNPAGRPQPFAYFVAVPLLAIVAAFLISLWEDAPPQGRDIVVGSLFAALFILAQITVLHFEVRRHGMTLTPHRDPAPAFAVLPLPLARHARSSPVCVALLAVQIWQRYSVVKLVFNLASVGLATTTAALIVLTYVQRVHHDARAGRPRPGWSSAAPSPPRPRSPWPRSSA